MKLLFILAFVVFSANTSLAQSKACYQKELNQKTKKVFSSQEEYDATRIDWQYRSPGRANPIYLWRAYNLYKKEQQKALALGNDKRAHCYIGCRIAQETDFHTADYVGWYKEERDLNDCKASTQFDELDYLSTVRGAEIGVQQDEGSTCARSCKQLY